MEKYSEYKDSGVQWLGEIPGHWEVVKLKRVAKVHSGATPKSGNPNYWDGSIEWITPADFKTASKTVGGGSRTITEIGMLSCSTKLIPKNSIVFSKRAPVGQVSITTKPLCTNQGCFACIPNKVISTHFLFYLLANYKNEFESLSIGTTFKELSTQSFCDFQIAIPPREEQDAMVEYLDKTTAKIDEAIRQQQRMIELLNERKQIIINNAVTKGLNPNVKMKDSGVEWIGEIPEHWEIVQLKRYCEVKTGKTPKTSNILYFENGNIDWYTPGDLNSFELSSSMRKVTQLAKKENACVIIPANSVYLVGIGGTIGKVGYSQKEASCNQQINAIIPKQNKLFSKYIAYFLLISKTQVIQMANLSTLPIINQDKTGSLIILVPPISEQNDIITLIEHKIVPIDDAINAASNQITLLQERKQIIINDVVTGKVKVS